MNRLKELRKEKGYTQIQMQMELGIDQSDYSKMERGAKNLTFHHAKAFALFFNVSIDYLAGLTEIRDAYPRSKDYR